MSSMGSVEVTKMLPLLEFFNKIHIIHIRKKLVEFFPLIFKRNILHTNLHTMTGLKGSNSMKTVEIPCDSY